MPWTFHSWQFFPWPYPLALRDITFSIWDEIHSFCLLRLGMYCTQNEMGGCIEIGIFLFCLTKVPIWLENAIWILGGMLCPMYWVYTPYNHSHTIARSGLWIMLAIHVHRWWHYTRCGCIQSECGENNRWTSCWCDETVFWFGAGLYGCKRVGFYCK